MEKEYSILEPQRGSLLNLPEKDLLFLIENYANKRNDYENIADLIRGDEGTIIRMMDNDRVFNKAMDSTSHILEISPFFLFSLILRRVFKERREDTEFVERTVDALNNAGTTNLWDNRRLQNLLKDAQVLDYMANLLARFAKSSRLFKVLEMGNISYQYIVDLIADSLRSDYNNRFHIYCHIGDYTLFLTGMIPECVEYKYGHRRRPIDRHYYIDFGKTYYCLASEHAKARGNNLSGTFSKLSEGFEVIIHVLHFMNRKYLYPRNAKFTEQQFDHLVINENEN